jgi:hypothetical protein
LKIVVRNESTNARVGEWDTGDDNEANTTWNYNGGTFSQSDTVSTGDVITLELDAQTKDIGTSGDSELRVSVTDVETDNQIAEATVRIR